MDVLSYKLATPSVVQWPGGGDCVELRPLPESALQAAERAAVARFRAHGCQECPAELDVERAIQELSRAMRVDADELRERVDENELGLLYLAWQRVQNASRPDIAQLRRTVRRAIHTEHWVTLDGAMAYRSSCNDFYGRSMLDLTSGQLAYYLAVREAYEEFFVPDSKGNVKKVSKAWLQSNSD